MSPTLFEEGNAKLVEYILMSAFNILTILEAHAIGLLRSRYSVMLMSNVNA